jgi:hypothetical protein
MSTEAEFLALQTQIRLDQPRLLAVDFDNTVALTSERGPHDMNVEKAYDLAVGSVMGAEALALYHARGGLKNRAPGQVVADLLPEDTLPELISEQTEALVKAKQSHTLKQVGAKLPDGTRWPRPTPGFIKLWLPAHDEDLLQTTILSSGHDPFIQKFFDVQDLPQPDDMLTDDYMRRIAETRDPEECVKPSPLLIQIIHDRWIARCTERALTDNKYSPNKATRQQIVSAGDDPQKDGQLAINGGVRFVHIEMPHTEKGWHEVGGLVLSGSQGHDGLR